MEGKWISVEDRLPDLKPLEYLRVLIYGKNKYIETCWYNSDVNQFLNDDRSKYEYGVTHWAELLDPPKEK